MNLSKITAAATMLFIAGVVATAAPIITFTTATGATTSGGAVNAQADFTLGAGSVGLTLTNLQANPKDVAQLISDIFFTVSEGGLALTSGAVTGTGIPITVAGDGTTTTGASVSAGYVLTNTAGLFHLDVLAGPGHAGPAHLIIGPAGTGGVYTNANGSIAGNKPHNPFLDQSATFTLAIPGVTTNSIISNVVFSFGTTAGANDVPAVPGIPPTNVAPEPASMTLMGTALGLLGYVGLRRRRSA